MHSMAEGQGMNEAGEEQKTREMGLRPSEPHETHRGRHEGHVTEDFKRRFIISMIFTVPILALSPFIQDLLRFKLEFPGSIYVLFLLSTFVYFYGGYPFLKGFSKEIQGSRFAVSYSFGCKIRSLGMIDSDSHGHKRRLLLQFGSSLWSKGRGLFLGAGDADRHHAPRPLGRDALGPGSFQSVWRSWSR